MKFDIPAIDTTNCPFRLDPIKFKDESFLMIFIGNHDEDYLTVSVDPDPYHKKDNLLPYTGTQMTRTKMETIFINNVPHIHYYVI